MSRKLLSAIAWGVAGLVVALALTAGAFALAGQEIGTPATPIIPSVSEPTSTPERTHSPKAERSDDPSPSVDDGSDDSGSSSPGSGSDDETTDNSGSGSDDDHPDDHDDD